MNNLTDFSVSGLLVSLDTTGQYPKAMVGLFSVNLAPDCDIKPDALVGSTVKVSVGAVLGVKGAFYRAKSIERVS